MFGLPSFAGNRGLFRIQDARVEGPGMLSVSGHILGAWDKPVSTGATNVFADLIAPSLGYAPANFLEFFAWTGGLFQKVEGTNKFGFHDKVIGGKLSFPWIPVLKLGGTGYYTFPRDNSFINRVIPIREKFGWKGLATLQLDEFLTSAPNLIFNYGQSHYGTSNFHSAGIGLELAARNLSVIVEVNSDQPRDSSLFNKNGTILVTPGLRFKGGGVGIDLGFSIGLTDPAQDYELIFGLSFSTPFLQKPKPALGTIAGKVTDARTGEPLSATISFPDLAKLAPITSDPNTGVFTAEKIPSSVVVVEASKEGYFKEAMPLTVPADGVVNYEFKLKPLVTYGVVAGKVLDVNDKHPLAAVISFPGTSIASMTSDSATGSFRVDNVPTGIISVQAEKQGYFQNAVTIQVEEGKVATVELNLASSAMLGTLTGKVSDKKTGNALKATLSFPGSGVADISADSATGIYKVQLPAGSHAVEVKAEGYITQSAVVIIEKDKIIEKNFEMVQKGMVITLKGVYFDFDKSTIKPESYPVLDDAAKILTDNPKITVEIQGHTDSDGSDSYNQKLSERRAYAIVDYFVKVKGIDVNRLKAIGYGESKPIASNDTKEGRSLNRRVEFVILGEMEQK
jgi:outer membrane protein OmpA-like peptidoglycan-associated protein